MVEDLIRIRGIGPKSAEKLVKAGIKSIEDLAESRPEELAFVKGIGILTAKKLIQQAKHLITFEKGLTIVLDHIKRNFVQTCPKCGGEMQKKLIILGPERRINARQCKICKFYMPN
ncbi:MAG: helix-hairpin-helix domain-containing protein [Promethearchaeia archaeon]